MRTVQELLTDIKNPQAVAAIHNLSITGNTNILASDLVPSKDSVLFRVMVVFDTAGVFKAVITQGGNSQIVAFREGSTLVAGAVYIFDLLAEQGDLINFQYSVDATLQVLRVQELVGGVQ